MIQVIDIHWCLKNCDSFTTTGAAAVVLLLPPPPFFFAACRLPAASSSSSSSGVVWWWYNNGTTTKVATATRYVVERQFMCIGYNRIMTTPTILQLRINARCAQNLPANSAVAESNAVGAYTLRIRPCLTPKITVQRHFSFY